MDGIRRIPIHRSLNRPTLVLGGDRELVLGAGLLSGVLIFSLGTWWGVALGCIFWIASIALLAKLGKADPLMRQVLARHQRYASYFPSAARWTGRQRDIPARWGRN